MRVLRLANSDDLIGDIPPDMRSAVVAERLLASVSGEPVETVRRTVWPGDGLPEIIEGWLDRYEPDIVSLTVSSFWVSFASVPLKLRRTLPVVGGPLAAVGFNLARRQRLAHNAAFRALRRRALHTVGGAYHFEPEYVAMLMDECIRRILRREQIGLAVRGPSPLLIDAGPAERAQSENRRRQLHTAMGSLCARVAVPYAGWDEPVGNEARFSRLGDFTHINPQEHQRRGVMEGELLVAAWRLRAYSVADSLEPLRRIPCRK